MTPERKTELRSEIRKKLSWYDGLDYKPANAVELAELLDELDSAPGWHLRPTSPGWWVHKRVADGKMSSPQFLSQFALSQFNEHLFEGVYGPIPEREAKQSLIAEPPEPTP